MPADVLASGKGDLKTSIRAGDRWLKGWHEANAAAPVPDSPPVDAEAKKPDGPRTSADQPVDIKVNPETPPEKPEGIGVDRKLRDFGKEPIDGFDREDEGPSGPRKEAYLNDARGYLGAVGKILRAKGFRPYTRKTKGGSTLDSPAIVINPAGPAVAGDVTLWLTNGDVGVMAQVGEMMGSRQILYRTEDPAARSSSRSGSNNWVRDDLTAGDLAEKLVALTRPKKEPVNAPDTKPEPGQTEAADAVDYTKDVEEEFLPDRNRPQAVNWATVSARKIGDKWSAFGGYDLPDRGTAGLPSSEARHAIYDTKEDAYAAGARKIIASVTSAKGASKASDKRGEAIIRWATTYLPESLPKAEEERELLPDGRWKARLGDEVWKYTAGFGGSRAVINGRVITNMQHELRVKMKTGTQLIGGTQDISRRKSVPLDASWTVAGDPRPEQMEQERADAEKKRKDEFARENREADEAAAARVKAAIDKGDAALTNDNAEVGMLVHNHWLQEDHIVGEVAEIGGKPTLFTYRADAEPEDQTPRSAPWKWFTVPEQPPARPSAPSAPSAAADPNADLNEMFDEQFAAEKAEVEKAEAPQEIKFSMNFGGQKVGEFSIKPEPTTGAAAASAATETGEGIEKTLRALDAMFRDPNKLGTLGAFDEEAYQRALPLFREAAQHFAKAGADIADVIRAVIKGLREMAGSSFDTIQRMKPYIVRYADDVRSGKEPFPHAETTKGPAAPAADGSRLVLLARTIADNLDTMGQNITIDRLQEIAKPIMGGTMAEGKYDRKDLYDAVELAINLFIQKNKDVQLSRPNDPITEKARSKARWLRNLMGRFPTQTVRTQEQIEFQQFSTPPDYAFAATWVANIGQGDTALEPTAGTGNIAVHMANQTNFVHTNELSERRADMLEALGVVVHTEDAEQLHNILSPDIKPTVVVMNPPFSQTAGRMGDKKDLMVAARHIEQALKRLEPGGRLVAIVGGGTDNQVRRSEGMSLTAPTYQDWWRKMRAEHTVRANVLVTGDIYTKNGTNFRTRLVVIDKTGPTEGRF